MSLLATKQVIKYTHFLYPLEEFKIAIISSLNVLKNWSLAQYLGLEFSMWEVFNYKLDTFF